MKKFYWVRSLNFEYDICFCSKDKTDPWHGTYHGPYTTLSAAKNKAREFIALDREALSYELEKIMTTRKRDLVSTDTAHKK